MSERKELDDESLDNVAGGVKNKTVRSNSSKTKIKNTKKQDISGQNDNEGIQGTNLGHANKVVGVGGNVSGGIKM